MSQTTKIDLDQALQRFGLKSFRPGQGEVISQVLAGQDCLCVMPTGGGKSLCYQLPAIVRPGLTIVVSPLIALMKDQVDALARRGIPATLINSSLSAYEQNDRLQDVVDGKHRLVYVAPERLRNQRFLEAIRSVPIQLLAIDEAHCISEWGHDFRPDYARIGRFRESLGNVQTIALTATATPRVRDDICNILRLRSPKMFITGFARTNLHFGALICHSDREKDWALCDFLKSKPGFGIIYASTRKRCEAIVETLGRELKIRVAAYHAGLLVEERKAVQERFMRGELDTIVATNAFGMGIDKSDLRFVVHYNMPGSLEAYYQEAGRAGRDGRPSVCLMMFSYQDRYIHEFFIENSYPPQDFVQTVYEFMQGRLEDPIELTLDEIREALNLPLSSEAVGTALQLIARTGVIDRLEAGAGLAMVRISSDLPTLVNLLPRDSKNRRKVLQALEKAVSDRRYEAVYVHPRWLMQHTELDRDALNRTLKELCKLEAVEYVPPFRGRAVHFRKHEVPFEQLGIDFEALAQRKAAEYEKLEQTIGFAQARQCRQLSILQYFGDPSAKVCGNCDRCQGTVGWPRVELGSDAPDEKPPQIAQTSLADIEPLLYSALRAIGRLHGRLGKILVALFLCGSESAKVQRLRLQRLEGFGLLKNLKQAEATKLLDCFLSCGLMSQQEVNKHRPTVSLTEFGEKVADRREPLPAHLKFDQKLLAKLRENVPGHSSSTAVAATEQTVSTPAKPNSKAPVEETKTAARKPAATPPAARKSDPTIQVPQEPSSQVSRPKEPEIRPLRKVPDATSSQGATVSNKSPETSAPSPSSHTPPPRITNTNPATPLESSKKTQGPSDKEVQGAGIKQLHRHPAQLKLLPNWDQLNRELAGRPSTPTENKNHQPVEDWMWTHRLAIQGFRLEECAAIRRTSQAEIVNDLVQAIGQGKEISLDTLFTKETFHAVDQLRSTQTIGSVRADDLVQGLVKLKSAIAEREKSRHLSENFKT
jgi:ATP-dependent DNA helicase RecQ